MEPELAYTVINQAVWMVVKLAAFLVIPSLLVGLIVAIFQAATQINEQTLSFLPRFLITLIAVIFGGHWMMGEITSLFNYIFFLIPEVATQ